MCVLVLFIQVRIKKYKTFFRVDIQLYQHEWKLEKREIVWKHDARRAECFHAISSFSNFHECWYNSISTRKNVLYLFYNTAMSKARRIRKISVFPSGGKFSVFTLSYVNTALNQSAFRIHKCYIIMFVMLSWVLYPRRASWKIFLATAGIEQSLVVNV